jgi:hypothetical protein
MTLSSGVNFEVGKSNLLPGAKLELNKMIEVIQNSPKSIWQITGHTDNTGSRSLNINLSYDRAQAVADYLVLNGVERSRLIVKGLGPDYPVADNSTEGGRALNRRVEIKFVESNNDVTGTPEEEVIELPYNVSSSRDYNAKIERHVGNMIFTDGSLYCFQVSSHRTRERAEKDAQKYRGLGYDVFVVEANLPSLDGIWYRVRIGYFNSLGEAREKRSELIE